MEEACKQSTTTDEENAPNAAQPSDPATAPPPSKRQRKPVDRGLYLAPEQRKKTIPRKPKKKQADAEAEFETVWICVECKEAECMMEPEATELLICDGLCRRLFHYPCAGLQKLPTEDESFICDDCQKGKHTCAICSNYGVDNEDVFKCMKSNCGLCFHESCLAMQNVEVELIPVVDDEKKPTSGDENEDAVSVNAKRRFVCPAHSCFTCTQTELKERENEEAPTGEASKGKKGKGKKKSKPGSSFESKKDKILTVRQKSVWMLPNNSEGPFSMQLSHTSIYPLF